jgi:ketose-bisphosphate aldolase
MPFEKVSTILKNADKKNIGVIGFDCFNYESIAWVIETAEEENAPVLIMYYPTFAQYIPASTFAAITIDLASRAKVPVGLHLDHCYSYPEILGVIKAGFTSVMIDGSSLPFEENVRVTAEIVKAAHAMGVDVEAELGHVGFASNKDDFVDTSRFTKVSDAVKFVELTGVDSLAIAIGSAHGLYVEKPKLDLQRLDEINKAIEIPLVLHGGTGIPDEQINRAVKLGINKLNVGTGYINEHYYKTKEIMVENKSSAMMVECLSTVKPEVKKFIRERIKTVNE